MRILFVCSTEFQLLNALNIKYKMFSECPADIVLQRPEYERFYSRLKRINLFTHVCYAKTERIGLHQYFRDITNIGHCEVNILQAIANTLLDFFHCVLGRIHGPRYRLHKLLYGYEYIKKLKYDKVFMQSGNVIVRNFYELLNEKAEMIILDEGVGSYINDTICHGNTRADAAYLYDTNMALYKDGKIDLIKIPCLSECDDKFVSIVNRVFEYKQEKKEYENKFIFFDQGGELMPAYLRNPGFIKRIIFANPIKKHRREYDRYCRQIELFKKIADHKKSYIKFHPRTPGSMLDKYDSDIFISIEPKKIPWEVFACNSHFRDCMFFTLFSSSVCLYPFTIGGDDKCILLCKYVDDNMDEKLRLFIDRLKERYMKNVVVIEGEEQLASIMREGRHS